MGTSTITRTTGFNGDGLIEVIDTPPRDGRRNGHHADGRVGSGWA